MHSSTGTAKKNVMFLFIIVFLTSNLLAHYNEAIAQSHVCLVGAQTCVAKTRDVSHAGTERVMLHR